MIDRKDIIVIGAGPAGYVTAIRAQQLGRKVTLIESDEVGGICLNKGCIPSKSLLSVTNFLSRSKQASKFGLKLTVDKVDISVLDSWKNGIVRQVTDGLKYLLSLHKVELVSGRAKFTVDKRLKVRLIESGEQLMEASNYIIATGSSARSLPELNFDGKRILSPEQAMADITFLPARLAIIGGGVIATELASRCQMLGANVTLIVRSEILRRFDTDIRSICRSSLENIGVRIISSAEIRNVNLKCDGINIRLSQNKRELALDVDKVVVAAGRQPNTSDLGLNEIDLNRDTYGFITVNDRYETNIPGIYAIGDVIGGSLLAHKASAEGVQVANIIAGIGSRPVLEYIPHMVFSACEVASVGLTREEAEMKGVKVKTGHFPFTALSNALANDNPIGFMKIVADQETDRILGVQIAGDCAAELIGEATLAIEEKITARKFADFVRPHPTYSEAFNDAALDVHSQAIHYFRMPALRRD